MINKQQKTIVKQEKNIVRLQEDVTKDRETFNSRLSSELERVYHVEQGELDFGNTHGGTYNGRKFLTATFKRRYTKKPKVFTNIRWQRTKTNKDFINTQIDVSSVTTTSVTIAVYRRKDDGAFYAMKVNWIAIPSDS